MKMSTEKTLDQQITQALEAVLRSKSSLISISDLPTQWQYNLHIINGYRFTGSTAQCIRSIFHIHNESFNIWSHLLGCVLLLGVLVYAWSPMPNINHNAANVFLTSVYYIYLLAAILCTVCSVSWHTMRCISSYNTMSCFSSIDNMGVTTLVIASVLVTQAVAFADSHFWQCSFMAASTTLGAAGLTACWHPIMCRPENSWSRILIWIALGVQGVAIPVVYLLWSRGAETALEIYGPFLRAYAPIVPSAIIYAAQFPECLWTGRFDFLGSSHNIHHVLSFLGIWLGVDALRNLCGNAGPIQ
jgi:adiponectin receptor